nr:uncharacterized protein LOC110073237 isoform X1 [Pogona vitticeps]
MCTSRKTRKSRPCSALQPFSSRTTTSPLARPIALSEKLSRARPGPGLGADDPQHPTKVFRGPLSPSTNAQRTAASCRAKRGFRVFHLAWNPCLSSTLPLLLGSYLSVCAPKDPVLWWLCSKGPEGLQRSAFRQLGQRVWKNAAPPAEVLEVRAPPGSMLGLPCPSPRPPSPPAHPGPSSQGHKPRGKSGQEKVSRKNWWPLDWSREAERPGREIPIDLGSERPGTLLVWAAG